MSIGDFVYKENQHIDIGFFHATIIKRYRDNQGRKVYKYLCDKCQTIHEKYEHLIENGSGCPVCANREVVKGINDIPTTDPWMVDYFPGGVNEASNFTSNCKKKFIPKCPFCGRMRDGPLTPNAIYTKHGMSCVCKDGISIPNKFIYGLMEQLKEQNQIIKFKREYPAIDEKGTRRLFDMFFEDISQNLYLLEMDGGLNHGNIIKEHKKQNGNSFPFVFAKFYYTDLMKDNISEKLKIPLIRIDCYKSDFDYIKNNILESELGKIFDLSNINWNKILQLCYGNLIKDVCDYKKKHPDCFSSEVAEIFNLSRYTVVNYWRYGTKLGWCYYDVEEEMHRSNTRYRPSITDCPVIVEDLMSYIVYRYNCFSEFIQKKDNDLDIPLTKKQLFSRLKDNNNIYYYENRYKITKLKSKKEELKWL